MNKQEQTLTTLLEDLRKAELRCWEGRLRAAADFLEQIDRELGFPPGGPVSPERTLNGIRKLKEKQK